MDPRARYPSGRTFDHALTLRPLTDKRISYYEKRGHYQKRRQHFTEDRLGRLVYTI
jgi:hypothetical protein